MKKNKELGITLITLVVAVCILIIISSLLIYNAKTGIKMRSLKMMYNDIELLSDKINSYYTKYGALPAEIEYKGNIYFEPQPNDNGTYYVIDLNALDNISLNYGFDFKYIQSSDDTSNYTNIYIINEESHHIYYVRGIEFDSKVYYTNDYDESVSIKPLISINLTLTYENQKLNASELLNIKEVTNENVPIPRGFYYVGGTKNEGVVISDVEGDDLENSKHGNQFVWVPVNQNQKLTLNVESKEKIAEIIITQPNGTKTTLNPNEKKYIGEIEMTYNGIYEVEVKTTTASKIASKRISSLYAQDVEAFIIQSKAYIIENAKLTFNTTEEFLQEAGFSTVEDFLNASNYPSLFQFMIDKDICINDQLNYEYVKENLIHLLNSLIDYNKNLESVNKYGGFYIGRFEAGDGTTQSARKSSTSDENELVVKKGAFVYNYVLADSAISLSSQMYSHNTAVTSQLITGSGWVRTLNWIVETGQKTESEVFENSTSWGNYNKSTGNAAINSGQENKNYTTGRSEYWKTNNIYDLAGNTWEFTQEIFLVNSKNVVQGGCFKNNNDGYAALCPGIYWIINNYTEVLSFRVELYINVTSDIEIGECGKRYDDDTTVIIGDEEVSIPGGATISKVPGECGDVDNGLVIYIIPKDETPDWEADTDRDGILDVQEKYDQFVWVPVPNPILDLSSEFDTLNETEIKSKIQEQINADKYPMAIKTNTTDYIGILYQFTQDGGKVKVEPYNSWTPMSKSGFREPTYLENNGSADGSNYNNTNPKISQNLLQQEFNTMVNKVSVQKGFWVGRYETSNMYGGNDGHDNSKDEINKIKVVKGTKNGVSGVDWYRMYAQQKSYRNLAGISANRTSGMIWGSQWDQIMIWMKEIKNENKNSFYVINSLGMGNYGTNDDLDTSTSSAALTGNSNNYKVKNIFDLAGNLHERTLEAYNTSIRVNRRSLL